MMTYDLKLPHLTQDEIEMVLNWLGEQGYEYDADFTTLYGPGWAFAGIRFHSEKALTAAREELAARNF